MDIAMGIEDKKQESQGIERTYDKNTDIGQALMSTESHIIVIN